MIALDDKRQMSSKSKSADKSDISKHWDKVYKKDILKVLKQLPDNSIDMVYGDPDYNVGIDYHGKKFTKEFSKFMEWYVNLTEECMRVLKEDGNLMMMNYPKPNSYLRVDYLDDASFSVHEYVWIYNTNIGQSKKYFTTAHRSILHATKSKNNKFYKENVAEEYLNPGPVRQKNMKKIKEQNPNISDKEAEKIFSEKYKGRMPYSWINEPLVKNVSNEKTIHPCQIPQTVSRKMILSCTQPGDTVLVLFGGSGSELEVCKENNRKYISAELHKTYYDLIKKRLKIGKIPDEYRHHTRKN